MNFVIKSIRNSITVWEHEYENLDKQGSSTYHFLLECLGDSRMDINDDYVLCSEDYYDKNRDLLKNRTRIHSCHLSIYDFDGMSEERKTFFGKRFGHGYFSDNDFGVEISLRHEVFESLIKHIDSGREITHFSTHFRSNDKINSLEFGSSFDGSHTIWKTSEEEWGKLLSIENFYMSFEILNKKESWEVEYDEKKREQLDSQKKLELMEMIENAITVSHQKIKEDIVRRLFKEFKPYLTLITLLVTAITLNLIFK